MAVLDPSWNYWKLAFWAQITAPFSVDVLYTVGLIIVSDTFPEDTQALAGAVFSTVGQIGTSLALVSSAVVEPLELVLTVCRDHVRSLLSESRGASRVAPTEYLLETKILRLC